MPTYMKIKVTLIFTFSKNSVNHFIKQGNISMSVYMFFSPGTWTKSKFNNFLKPLYTTDTRK